MGSAEVRDLCGFSAALVDDGDAFMTEKILDSPTGFAKPMTSRREETLAVTRDQLAVAGGG